MRPRWSFAIALTVVFAFTASAVPEAALDEESQAAVATCLAACTATEEACRAAADAEVERCRTKPFKACEVWCPCTRFIGAAYFHCLLNCDRCTANAKAIAARCADGSDAKAICAQAHRRCTANCAAPPADAAE